MRELGYGGRQIINLVTRSENCNRHDMEKEARLILKSMELEE